MKTSATWELREPDQKVARLKQNKPSIDSLIGSSPPLNLKKLLSRFKSGEGVVDNYWDIIDEQNPKWLEVRFEQVSEMCGLET
jgi:hypothetical protein